MSQSREHYLSDQAWTATPHEPAGDSPQAAAALLQGMGIALDDLDIQASQVLLREAGQALGAAIRGIAALYGAGVDPAPRMAMNALTLQPIEDNPLRLGQSYPDTLRAMFDALGGCWVPPANGEAWAGMEISIRFAFKRSGDLIAAPVMTYASLHAPASARQSYFDSIRGALERCNPLPFTAGLGGAIAGRPIAVRFIENRVLRKIAEQP